MDVRQAAKRWAETWATGWVAADVDRIAALYAPGATFFSEPFREHQPPGEYVAWAFSQQAEAACRFGEPLVDGDRAAVDWWAVVGSRDGSVETLAGTSLLQFSEDGLVLEQRDAWSSAPGRVELEHWGR